MIKSELIEKLANTNPHLMHRDVEKVVNVIFEEITGALAKGDRVELRGFGAFSVKHRPARVGRNPRTGDQVHVAEKYVPYFKTGKELRIRLNPAVETPAEEMPKGKKKAPVKTAGSKAADHKAGSAKAAKPASGAKAGPNGKSSAGGKSSAKKAS